MKKIITIISVICIFSQTFAFAEEKKVDNVASEKLSVIEAEKNFDCVKVAGSIRKNINELGECWEDTDCLLVNFGCPWQEGVCHHSIAGKDEQDKFDEINKKIFSFNNICITKNKKLKEMCDRYKKISASVKCKAQKLSCLNGRCVTQTEILLQGIGTRPGSFGYENTKKNKLKDNK